MLKINIAEWTDRFKKMKRSLAAQARHGRPYSVALTTREIFNTAVDVLARVDAAAPSSYRMKAPKPDQTPGYIAFTGREAGMAFLNNMKAMGVEAIMFRADDRKKDDLDTEECGYYPHKLSAQFMDEVQRSGPYDLVYGTRQDNSLTLLIVKARPVIYIKPVPKVWE